ncbi:set1/Ash2 histone methyltransferase complex subunit ASH2-like [Amphibalanus amphitrite]|uniref:set1/Ash2 histone methyltransferase complex subunit ASH2-like n=1 Tax=Amphibalanus amphitrite TaxID=1232801 RepID=UPI001C905DE1|nr:set1/Ash2 histone methyltransferase complex subunit ASH2-like [Amphibalanus amphitrite]XP_043226697.1 set1/Ash2 histone methyltransferase complex subunit ASH2-like [Amphibalanus amphitrite]XP_043226698.1 set1/Ash2 histone methyltransferase complex subunit ASH2-like [Amphibalanus amphitrite]XP_043226699.1 set1/Ash2 histone methyltransferase complex subunit ASH2-like [Amphibalanus amphitrite]XP_043226700.1 set1/Ash2 histone methyltransferase complex subunit ASH2-like [Amphibalanus amphitrite]
MKPENASDSLGKASQKHNEHKEEFCGYCGKGRNLNIVELQCSGCLLFHHESCISLQLGKLVPFLSNYTFTCRNCSNTRLETFKKHQAQSSQMCVTALANLQQAALRDDGRTIFSLAKDIVPWIEMHWEGMTTMARRTTQSWKQTIQRTLVKDSSGLFRCEEAAGDTSPMYGLRQTNLALIRPSYEQLKKAQPEAAKSRGPKRKMPEQSAGWKKSRSDGAVQKLHGYPLDHPFNKDGYRYILTEPDPHAPFRQEFDESSDTGGRPIPGWLHRAQCPPAVLLALHDRAQCLRISDDRLSVTGDKGYCMVRATHCVRRGTWYWEATITAQPEGAHCRIGWGGPLANLNAPLGYDKFGYSWRSRKGTVFHEARGRHLSPGYQQGDVLGILIHLPEAAIPARLPDSYKDKPLIKSKSHLYFEDKDDVAGTLERLKPVPGAYIAFYKNGKLQGQTFHNLYGSDYYPAVSVYRGITVTVNFGPAFKHPPRDVAFRAVYERAEEHAVQQALSDVAWLTEHEGKLSIDL